MECGAALTPAAGAGVDVPPSMTGTLVRDLLVADGYQARKHAAWTLGESPGALGCQGVLALGSALSGLCTPSIPAVYP